MKHSKSYITKIKNYEKNHKYSLNKAIDILQNFSKIKFDETVDISFKLGTDARQSDQNIRGAINLPNGSGRNVRVVVICDANSSKAALKAGADEAGFDEIIDKIKSGWLDFDVLIATPDAMKKVRILGRQLGPRGLMPNPKTGTVTENIAEAVQSSKSGRVEYKTDKGSCCHIVVGKMSFSAKDLFENCRMVIETIIKARPASTKGIYLQSCTISSTMSPGVKVDLKDIIKE